MKHNIKLPDGTIKEIDCRLGSSILDKHGREIFEGYKVNTPYGIATAVFYGGAFRVNAYLLDMFDSFNLEIVDEE